MAFTQAQVRKLAGKLPERFVKTRTERGMTLSYVEGWHVIDEANQVFGFDGWDRETVSAECVWQDARTGPKTCSYAVRVRITVRAGKTVVAREGAGVGHGAGAGATLGEAHESALKEAETDATKRALVTFGNLFGLALYDKDQAGVRRESAKGHEAGAAPVTWAFVASHAPPTVCDTPQQFCSAAKENLGQAKTPSELEALWAGNAPVVARLRTVRPELRTRSGLHYADVLENLYRRQRDLLAQDAANPEAVSAPAAADDAEIAIVIPRRLRDPAHLRYIASLPCIVCGRTPSHAHHLRFVQPRSLGSKPSDEWTVPLCPIHHRALHDFGREDEWWRTKGIDAKAEAERLWQTTHAPAALLEEDTAARATQAATAPGDSPATGAHTAIVTTATGAPKPPPADGDDQPIPLNVHGNTSGC